MKQRNKCVSLRKKSIRQHFKQATENVADIESWLLEPSKTFSVKQRGLSLLWYFPGKNGKIITEDKQLTEIFNDHYINIVEKSSGREPCNVADIVDTDEVTTLILEEYQNHPSILAINQNPEKNLNPCLFH